MIPQAKNIGEIQKHYEDLMKADLQIKKIFVKNLQFNVELYVSREGGEIKITTIHL